MMNGHFFCSNCDDIVFLQMQPETSGLHICSICNRLAVEWIPHIERLKVPRFNVRNVTDQEARKMFKKMRDEINKDEK